KVGTHVLEFLPPGDTSAKRGVTRQARAARAPDKRNFSEQEKSSMQVRYLALAGVSLLFSASSAVAQDDVDGDAGENVIVVTGRGLDAPPSVIAYSTITLDRDQMRSTASGRIEDALSN